MNPLFAQQLQQKIHDAFVQLAIPTCDTAIQLLTDYLAALHLWNKAYNLTAIRDIDGMLVKHVCDSLAILPHLPEGKLLDVGTGGGMPGLIVAICQPHRHTVLLDSNGKKVRFLKQFISDHSLANVTAIQARVEDDSLIASHGYFDIITSRAFAELNDFVSISEHLLAPEGAFFAMKSQSLPEEVQALSKDWHITQTELSVPYLNEQRFLCVVSKPS